MPGGRRSRQIRRDRVRPFQEFALFKEVDPRHRMINLSDRVRVRFLVHVFPKGVVGLKFECLAIGALCIRIFLQPEEGVPPKGSTLTVRRLIRDIF